MRTLDFCCRVLTTGLLTLTLFTAACSKTSTSNNVWLPADPIPIRGTAAHKMEEPAADAHWTLKLAYDADGCELEYQRSYTTIPVTEGPIGPDLPLDDTQPFAFQWRSYDLATMMNSFTLLEDGRAFVTSTRYDEISGDGQRVLTPSSIQAEFKLSAAEVRLIREAIQSADLSGAPRYFERKDIYDGLQWGMNLRVDGRTKAVGFSNAVPERYRDLIVAIYRDVCAKHADEIDRGPLVDGFPAIPHEFAIKD